MSWYKEPQGIPGNIQRYLKDIETIFKVQNAKKEWIPYMLEPHQKEWHMEDVAILGPEAKHKITTKSRNTSFTVSSTISILMAVPFYPDQVIPIVRLNKDRANDLINDFKNIIKHMNVIKEPDGRLFPFDPSKVDMDAAGSIKFPNGVEIRAFPATNSASESIRGLRIAGCAGIIDECLPHEVRIQTNKGLIPICMLPNKKDIKIKSFNIKTKQIEYTKFNGLIKKELKERELYYISVQKNTYSIKCTNIHKFYTEDFTIKKANKLKIGDVLICDNNKNGNALSNIQKEIIYGVLLGDGSLTIEHKYKKSCHLSITHSIKQQQYQEHLVKIFDCKVGKYNKTSFGGVVNIIRSQNTKEMKKIYDEIYFPKKKITTKYLNKLTDISIAYWFMDDGSKSSNCYSLATHSFSYDEHILIQQFFKNKYNIITKIRYDKRCKLYYLTFGRIESRQLTKIISKYIIPSMRYKLINNSEKINNDKHIDKYKELNIEKLNYKKTKILDIKKVKRRCRVYNIEVAKNHNYFIEGMGTLSKNSNFMKDFNNIYIALRDAAAGSVDGKKEFQILIGTTRKGRATPFNLWYEEVFKNKPNNMRFYKWPVFNPELVDLNKDLREQELEPIVHWHDINDLEEKRSENLNTFKEEYMGMLVDGDDQFYDYNKIIASINPELTNYNIPPHIGEYWMGIDVATGIGKDYFVISIFEKSGDKYVQRLLQYTRDKDIPDMEKHCLNVIELWKPAKIRIDSVGVGTQITQALMKQHPHTEPIKGNMNIKGLAKNQHIPLNEYLHTNQNALINYEMIELLSDEIQIQHYAAWNGNFKAESGVQGHGDITMANGYCLLPDKWKYGKRIVKMETSHLFRPTIDEEKAKEIKKEFETNILKRVDWYKKQAKSQRRI